jgi:hypothetical protein
MSAAEKVLIVGGVLNVCYGVVTGIPMTIARTRGAPAVSKYLTLAHIGPLMQGPILLGMAVAARLSDLSADIELAGAWLLVGGSLLLAAKDTFNWLLGVSDEFTEKPASRPLGVLSVVGTTLGTAILAVGVIHGI